VKRLVMIMGVQRSGTNALFKCLTSSAGVQGYNESPDNDFFEGINLRPERELRELIRRAPRHLVLKPINETMHRQVGDVLQEFALHAPRVVWIFRDPVNCYQSHIVQWKGFRDKPAAFAEAWCRRNASALAACGDQAEELAVVAYEDLVADPAVLKELCGFLGIPGAYLFRGDSGGGRRAQPPEVQERIDALTAQVWQQLRAARSFRARSASDLERGTQRLKGRLERLRAKLGRGR